MHTFLISLYRETIAKFAEEYHESRYVNGTGGPRTISFVSVPLKPTLPARDSNLAVIFWIREELLRAATDAKKGETSGDSSARTKAKPGRPPKGLSDNTSKIRYLQHSDGTFVSQAKLTTLSNKAHTLWITLNSWNQAPKTFGKMSKPAWDYYSRMMLSEPELYFLLLCDDGEWKLKEWSTKNYSCWSGNVGLREKRTKEKTEPVQVLDDSNLLTIEHGDEIEHTDHSPDNDECDLGDDDSNGNDHNTNVDNENPDTDPNKNHGSDPLEKEGQAARPNSTRGSVRPIPNHCALYFIHLRSYSTCRSPNHPLPVIQS